MNKELAVSVQTSGWFNPLFGGEANAFEAFAFLKSCGFDAIDYNIDTKYPSADVRAEKLGGFYAQDIETILDYYRPVKEALDKAGVTVAQAHAPFPLHIENNEAMNDFLLASVEKCCAVCQMLECPAIVVHPWTGPDKKYEREVNLAMYRRMIPIGKKYGVKLCLENMLGWAAGHHISGACANVEEAVWYIDTLNSEAGEEIFGFCYDIGHANVAGNNLRNDVLTLGHRLTVLHLHDNDARRDQHLAPYTSKATSRGNTTDWDGFLSGLHEIGYRGALNFETFAAFVHTPIEGAPSMLRYIADIGKYFRKRVLEA